MSRAIFVAVLLGVLPALFSAGAPSPFIGTYKDAKISVSIGSAAGGYAGTISMGDKVFDFTAGEVDGKLAGNFKSGEESYTFIAELKADALVFKTGSASYDLARQGAAATPDKTEKPREPMQKPIAPPVPVPPQLPPQPGPASDKIELAIQRAKDYLLNQQKNGSWDLPTRAPEPKPNAQMQINVIDIQNSSQWGGVTALVTYALLAEGENATDAT